MKQLKKLALLSISALSAASFACDERGLTGWAPDNSWYIGTNMTRMANINEVEFNYILDRVEDFARQDVADAGGNLVIKRLWNDGTVNASADRNDGNYNLNMYGGLARHPLISSEGFAMVACHELGHHIGGAPKKKILWFTMWASNEGQSDYFAGAKCMRKYFEKDNNRAIADTLDLPESVKAGCERSFSDDNEIAICERIASAGKNLAAVLNSLKDAPGPTPDFETPDTSVVASTNHEHPAAQCRLDTYYQGGLCPVSEFNKPSETDPNTGYCSSQSGHRFGLRPLCWYKP